MESSNIWLKSRNWDLSLIIFSAIIAIIPYSLFVLLGGNLTETADAKGSLSYNARLLVNTIVLVGLGGPHMYATFTRTLMDPITFKRKKTLYIATSILVPAFVFSMAIFSYESYVWLLTIFFMMASLHALHQIIWICGAYDIKSGIKVTWFDKFVDYGVVFSSLYPVPFWHVTNGQLLIGPVDLKVNQIFDGYQILAYLMGAFFLLMLGLFIGKTINEYLNQTIHWGKTLLIVVTVLVMTGMPLLPNLDTAFQGINTWHSFQYLMLTWLAHTVLRQQKGKSGIIDFWKNLYSKAKDSSKSIYGLPKSLVAEFSRAMNKIDNNTGWSSFYLITIAMLPVSGILIIFTQSFLPDLHSGQPGADEVYQYMGILSVLLIHYVHDGLLFTDHEDLVMEYEGE